MIKLSILLFFTVLGLTGCNKPVVKVVCDGVSQFQATFLGSNPAGFYILKIEQTIFRLPIIKCVIIQEN